MTLEIKDLGGGAWAVVNDKGEQLFAGTKQDCEDWLDAWENR